MAKVLVIDDDSHLRGVIVRILVRGHHQVFEAADGNKGLDQFAMHRPEVVITDLLMPEKEGIETIRELRRIAPMLRIVAMSGGGTDNDSIFLGMAKMLGADAVLAKPFRAEELLRAVG